MAREAGATESLSELCHLSALQQQVCIMTALVEKPCVLECSRPTYSMICFVGDGPA